MQNRDAQCVFFLFQTKTDVLQMQLMLKNNSPLKQRHEEETEELSNFTQRNKSDKSRECKTVLKTFFGGGVGGVEERLMAA